MSAATPLAPPPITSSAQLSPSRVQTRALRHGLLVPLPSSRPRGLYFVSAAQREEEKRIEDERNIEEGGERPATPNCSRCHVPPRQNPSVLAPSPPIVAPVHHAAARFSWHPKQAAALPVLSSVCRRPKLPITYNHHQFHFNPSPITAITTKPIQSHNPSQSNSSLQAITTFTFHIQSITQHRSSLRRRTTTVKKKRNGEKEMKETGKKKREKEKKWRKEEDEKERDERGRGDSRRRKKKGQKKLKKNLNRRL